MLIYARTAKSARSKRLAAAREPQRHEVIKRALFLHYSKTSMLLNTALIDLHNLKAPWAIKFKKSNPIHPFSDPSSFEFFSQKNDCSQLVFASHSKKRPASTTWIRCFGGQILDMVEMNINQESFRPMAQFKGRKPNTGVRPTISFSGAIWDDPNEPRLAQIKNIFIDFFRGPNSQEIGPQELQVHISFMAGNISGVEEWPIIRMRCWNIVSRQEKHAIPSIALEEIGPRLDFSIGRIRLAPEDLMKQAMKTANKSQVSHLHLRVIYFQLIRDSPQRQRMWKRTL